jgi:tRNA threonylcarbamoyladenosine biosynthesis protein TsaB
MAQIRNKIQTLLAVETSSSPGSVAVGTRATNLAAALVFQEHPLAAAGNQGRDLMPTIHAATAAAGWLLADVELVAVAIGPGPFTGLRVGVTTAKAIAWSTGCDLVGVSTAACLAEQATAAVAPVDRPADRVDVAFAAGRGELFVTTATPLAPDAPHCWQTNAGQLTTPAAWWESLPEGGLITGPGLSLSDEDSAELTAARPDLRLAPANLWQPTATTVAHLGLAAAARGSTHSHAELLPVYLRASYAEDRARTT